MSKSAISESESSYESPKGEGYRQSDAVYYPKISTSSGSLFPFQSSESYVPVMKVAGAVETVTVVVRIDTPEEKLMAWANDWLDEARPQQGVSSAELE